ncbi:MAG: hypothetical protein LBU65_11610 [Planctomycetaceae bacterium]|jgi:hypothetical protein|nr:hypothetical protein [Planctomycetaceae bacterium]
MRAVTLDRFCNHVKIFVRMREGPSVRRDFYKDSGGHFGFDRARLFAQLISFLSNKKGQGGLNG